MALLVMLMSGCSQTNLAEILQAAGRDPASVCGSVMTPYGNLKFARTNITNGDVVCNQDGLTVKSQPPSVPVGIQVLPGPLGQPLPGQPSEHPTLRPQRYEPRWERAPHLTNGMEEDTVLIRVLDALRGMQ